MLALFLQTLALMAVAYFAGAALACLVRRTFFPIAEPVPAAAEHRVDPLPEIQQQVAGAMRLGRGGTGAPVRAARPASSPITIPAQPMPAGHAPARPSAITVPAVDLVPADDLKRIRRIDAALERELNAQGVRRYEHVAGWLRADVERIGRALGLGARISQENWIEQAQILAKGGETHFSARLARGETARGAPSPDEGDPPLPAAPPAAVAPQVADVALVAAAALATVPRVSERAAFAAPRRGPAPAATDAVSSLQPAVALRPSAPPAHDNLQRISQVDPAAERDLIAQGITRYSQIAQWSPADITRMDTRFGGTGRIGRENWVEQAQILSRGGDTAYSREYDRRAGEAAGADTAAPGGAAREARADLAALRSVRSEAYQREAPAAAPRAASIGRAGRQGSPEDLKRIRGIGVLIEKKLNSMGVASYEQMANWTAEDIARVSQSLDFKGRIERENWVEQARILASGGATEFSRRVDRGELETSRYRP